MTSIYLPRFPLPHTRTHTPPPPKEKKNNPTITRTNKHAQNHHQKQKHQADKVDVYLKRLGVPFPESPKTRMEPKPQGAFVCFFGGERTTHALITHLCLSLSHNNKCTYMRVYVYMRVHMRV